MEAHLLEYRILSFMRSRDAYIKYAPVIRETLFESKFSRYIYKLIVYYHRKIKGKSKVPLSSLFTLVSSRIKENEVEKYNEIIRKIKKFPFTDTTIADDVVRKFAKRQNLKIMIMDAVHSLDHEEDIDLEKLRQRVDDVMTVETAELANSSYDYFTNPYKRLEEDKNEERIATLLHADIDNAMRRGLAAGEIAIVIAPTNIGKTMFLINIAYNAMLQGKKVIYVTLELSGKKIAGRFDQIITKKPIEIIEANPSLVFKATKKLASHGGGLYIKDVTHARLSVADLSVFLENHRRNKQFDLVIVDQADLMYSPKEFRERRFELSSVIIGLRRMGANFGIPVWTASQATRAAGAAGTTTIWDIAEDIGKANWADIIFTLSQSPEDREENIMFINLEKNRIGPGNPRKTLQIDYPLMRLKCSE